MTVRLDGDLIRLEGACHVEEAEALLRLIHDAPGRGIDLSDCKRLHAAVVQVLISFGATIAVPAQDPFLCDFVAPNLRDPHDRGDALETSID